MPDAEPLDLEAIKARYAATDATANVSSHGINPCCHSASDVPDLIAEIERLRRRV